MLIVVPFAVALLLRLVGWTLRFEVIAEPGAVPATASRQRNLLLLASMHAAVRVVLPQISLLHPDQPQL